MFFRSFNKSVDLVYLWCDGNDPKFIEQKNFWLKKEGKEPDIQATNTSRWAEIEELKFSLRSVEECAPWVNHIYIVTNGQIPNWLNTNHQKITIIDHCQILPKEALPTFNSSAIEAGLANIPNLSDYFLLANDDTFFNRSIKKSFFFQKNGDPIVRVKPKKLSLDLYDTMILTARNKIKEKYGQEYLYETHHNIDAYRRLDYHNCTKVFDKEFSETAYHRFRRKDSIQRTIINFYQVAINHGKFKNIAITSYQKFLRKLHLVRLDSLYLSNRENLEKIIKRYRPALFCINDVVSSTDDNRKKSRLFLEKRFPHKSSFEK